MTFQFKSLTTAGENKCFQINLLYGNVTFNKRGPIEAKGGRLYRLRSCLKVRFDDKQTMDGRRRRVAALVRSGPGRMESKLKPILSHLSGRPSAFDTSAAGKKTCAGVNAVRNCPSPPSESRALSLLLSATCHFNNAAANLFGADRLETLFRNSNYKLLASHNKNKQPILAFPITQWSKRTQSIFGPSFYWAGWLTFKTRWNIQAQQKQPNRCTKDWRI